MKGPREGEYSLLREEVDMIPAGSIRFIACEHVWSTRGWWLPVIVTRGRWDEFVVGKYSVLYHDTAVYVAIRGADAPTRFGFFVPPLLTC